MKLTDEILSKCFPEVVGQNFWTVFDHIEIEKENGVYWLNTYDKGFFGRTNKDALREVTTVNDLLQVMKGLTGRNFYIPQYHNPT